LIRRSFSYGYSTKLRAKCQSTSPPVGSRPRLRSEKGVRHTRLPSLPFLIHSSTHSQGRLATTSYYLLSIISYLEKSGPDPHPRQPSLRAPLGRSNPAPRPSRHWIASLTLATMLPQTTRQPSRPRSLPSPLARTPRNTHSSERHPYLLSLIRIPTCISPPFARMMAYG
jgi:hypothetical protein